MKRVLITLVLDCRADVPAHVLEWMAGNVLDHAQREFDGDYDPAFVHPPYDGPPLAGVGGSVAVRELLDAEEAS